MLAPSGKQQMLYIQMEFCPRTLRQALDEGPLDDLVAWRMVRQILAGLAHIHAQGIIHRHAPRLSCTPRSVFGGSCEQAVTTLMRPRVDCRTATAAATSSRQTSSSTAAATPSWATLAWPSLRPARAWVQPPHMKLTRRRQSWRTTSSTLVRLHADSSSYL